MEPLTTLSPWMPSSISSSSSSLTSSSSSLTTASSSSQLVDVYGHKDNPGHQFVHFSEAVIQPIILGIGIVTNIISLLVLRRTFIASVFKICITSLTITDLFASIFGFSQILVEVIAFNGDIPFGIYYNSSIAIHTLYYLFTMFMAMSSGIVILIVVIRSIMVAKPMSSRNYLTSGRIKVFCAVVCVFTFVVFIPTGINVMWQVCYADFYQNEICQKFQNATWALGYLYTLVVIYGPLLIITYVICFIVIKINLTKANKDVECMMDPDINSSEIASRLQQTAKITQILIAILVLDCICIVPTVIQGAGLIIAPNEFLFNKQYAAANVLDVICEIFLCSRPTVNFAIYVCMHKEFRRKVAELFGEGKLWAQTALSDMVPSSARGSTGNIKTLSCTPLKNAKNDCAASNPNLTTNTIVELTPLAKKKISLSAIQNQNLGHNGLNGHGRNEDVITVAVPNENDTLLEK